MRYSQWPVGSEPVAPPPGSPAVQVETRAPARDSRIESEVAVPLLHTLITAGIVALALAFAAWRLDWAWDVPIWAGIGVLCLMWTGRLWRSDALLWTRERITQHDLNGDGRIGKPHGVVLFSAPPGAHVTPGAGSEPKRALVAFVTACYVMGATSERAHGIRPWQRGRYTDFRAALLRLGLAQWRDSGDHKQGWQMVGSLDAALAAIDAHVL